MAKTVNIKLSSSTGSSTGPTFDLFSDANSYASAFESGVSKTTLMGAGGYTSTVVPDEATIIRVKSTGTCTTYDDYTLASQTPTPTPTPTAVAQTPTPTPTPTATGEVQITNCVRLVKSRPAVDPNCSTTRIQRVTVTLYDSTGANEVDATYDITITLGGTGDDGEPTTWDLIIPPGESFAYDDIIVGEQTSGECTLRDSTGVTRLVGGIESISNSSIVECEAIPPPEGTVFNTFYYGQGLSTSIAHCGTDYTINASFFATGSTISGLFGQIIYTTNTGSSAFNGLGLWWPVALETGTDTEFGNYYVIEIDSNGTVGDIAFIGDCDEAVPL
jgi:hypothetical protein